MSKKQDEIFKAAEEIGIKPYYIDNPMLKPMAKNAILLTPSDQNIKRLSLTVREIIQQFGLDVKIEVSSPNIQNLKQDLEESKTLLKIINNKALGYAANGLDFLAHTGLRERIEKLIK